MCEKDIPFVHEIEMNTFSDPWSGDDFKKSIIDVNNLYLVVEENNEILGYCGLWGVVGEGQINNVAVKESARGRGIARNMLNTLIQQGREQGLEAFTLEVRVNNYPAISLYHSLGFKDAGIRKNFYEKPTEDALIMWLH
jgi:[ribosomal protein S18]-alanine N-acetyltransferase